MLLATGTRVRRCWFLGLAALLRVGQQDLAQHEADDLDGDAADINEGDQADRHQAGLGQPGVGAQLVDHEVVAPMKQQELERALGDPGDALEAPETAEVAQGVGPVLERADQLGVWRRRPRGWRRPRGYGRRARR